MRSDKLDIGAAMDAIKKDRLNIIITGVFVGALIGSLMGLVLMSTQTYKSVKNRPTLKYSVSQQKFISIKKRGWKIFKPCIKEECEDIKIYNKIYVK